MGTKECSRSRKQAIVSSQVHPRSARMQAGLDILAAIFLSLEEWTTSRLAGWLPVVSPIPQTGPCRQRNDDATSLLAVFTARTQDQPTLISIISKNQHCTWLWAPGCPRPRTHMWTPTLLVGICRLEGGSGRRPPP